MAEIANLTLAETRKNPATFYHTVVHTDDILIGVHSV